MITKIKSMIEAILKVLNSVPCDKRGHALSGLILYCFVSYINLELAIGLVIVAGVSKEIYDKYMPNHTSDYKDAVATVLVPVILYTMDKLL